MTIRSKLVRTATALSITATTSLLAVSAHADTPAARSDRAMDTCIAAFIAANLPKEQPVRVLKEDSVASPLDTHNREYKIVLKATGAESGKRLARGVCIVDRSGTVIAMNGKRLPEQLAQTEVSPAQKTAAR